MIKNGSDQVRKLLNVLYVTNPQAYLSKDGENIVVSIKGSEAKRIPIHNLEGVICFGYLGASPQLMAMCAERGVGLSFLTEYGKFLCRVTGKISGNVLLRKQQYKISDSEEHSSTFAKYFILGKLINCRNVLLRFKRDYKEKCTGEYFDKLHQLEDIIEIVDKTDSKDLDYLRGLEGSGSRLYFENFNLLILNDEVDFEFKGRTKRPPLDRVNALLSFIYVLLASAVTNALETVGLDPQVGFLHRDRPGRNSLALDVMEELRPYLADRLALTLINNNVIKAKDFVTKENGAVLLEDEGRKKVLQYWQTKKKDIITHPILDEKIEIGLLPYVQSLLMARTIRGDMEYYPPFISR